MNASSFKQAKKNYDFLVDLSNNWLIRYYGKNFNVLGVNLEKVQAFSQFYFFTNLFENRNMKDVWTTYPEKGTDNRPLYFKVLTRILDLLKGILRPVKKADILNGNHDLIIVSSGRHLENLLNLLYFLKSKYNIFVVGKIELNTQTLLRKKNIEFLNISCGRDFMPRIERLSLIFKYLMKNWTAKRHHKFLKGEKWFSRLFYLKLVQLPEIEALIKIANQVYTKNKAKIILTSSSNDLFGSAFTLTAQSLNMGVVEIQHGLSVWKIIESNFYNSDYYLVWGEVSKKRHPKNAVIAGCPYFKKEQILKNPTNFTRLKKVRILVLWTPPFGEMSLFKTKPDSEILENLLAGLTNLPSSWKVILRSHPGYNFESFVEDIKFPLNVATDREKDIWKSIEKSDIVVTQPTTAGLISMMQKKPMLFFDSSYLSKQFGDNIFLESKCATNVPTRDLSRISVYIKRIVSDTNLRKRQIEAQETFLSHYFYCMGEDSFKRISEIIMKHQKHV